MTKKIACGIPVRLRHVILALIKTQGLLMGCFSSAQSHFQEINHPKNYKAENIQISAALGAIQTHTSFMSL